MADLTDAPPFRFVRSGRSPGALAVLGGLYVVLGLAWWRLDAAPWIVGAVAVLSLPALWEAWQDTRAGIEIDAADLRWFSGRRRGSVVLAELQRVRLDTRLDLSLRMTLMLDTGRKLRLPAECVPPVDALVTALDAHGIKHERHHFALF